MPGKRGSLSRLRAAGRGEHPLRPGAGRLADPLRAHPPRAGRRVHGRDVRPRHRPGGGGLGDAGPGRHQHAARRGRRHHQQHPVGRNLGTGRPGPRVQGVAPIRRPGDRCSRPSPAGPTASRPSRAIPEMFRKAFKLAETERPAAVYLAVPEHIDADDSGLRPDAVAAQRGARRSAVARSGAAGGRGSAEAKRPVVLAGHGAARGRRDRGPGAILRGTGCAGGQHLPRQGRHARRSPQQHRHHRLHASRLRQLRFRQRRRDHRGRLRAAGIRPGPDQPERPTRRSSTSIGSRPRSTCTIPVASESSATSALRWTH